MTPEEHHKRHIELHRALDELFADYIAHHPNQVEFLDMPFRQFLEWSYQQTVAPTELIKMGLAEPVKNGFWGKTPQ